MTSKITHYILMIYNKKKKGCNYSGSSGEAASRVLPNTVSKPF